jgi:hypothetical protein
VQRVQLETRVPLELRVQRQILALQELRVQQEQQEYKGQLVLQAKMAQQQIQGLQEFKDQLAH